MFMTDTRDKFRILLPQKVFGEGSFTYVDACLFILLFLWATLQGTGLPMSTFSKTYIFNSCTVVSRSVQIGALSTPLLLLTRA